jgi:subtilisin family serine protease
MCVQSCLHRPDLQHLRRKHPLRKSVVAGRFSITALALALAGLICADNSVAAARGGGSGPGARESRPTAAREPGRPHHVQKGPVERRPAHEARRQPVHSPTALGRLRRGDARPTGLARNGLPVRPFPGEAGFTGVPPRGETRFVPDEMIVRVGAGVRRQTLAAATRRFGLTLIGSQNLAFVGGTLFHFRIGAGRQVEDVIRAFETQSIGIAQPNYLFDLQEDARTPATQPTGDPAQYAVSKLNLIEAHHISIGNYVMVAIIDSRIDAGHPDLRGSIADADRFNVAGRPQDQPDKHGTAMASAIVAHGTLLGVAPRARILAIQAFATNAQSPRAATPNIIAGIDWAITRGARVINMSFAGPYDPMLQVALKKAHDKGVILVAAAGNMGPDSPPQYPAADENVIAVTAIDKNDRLLPRANQGPHIALAAPGVDIFEATPNASYDFTTGTSVAAAHVSGVAALLIERAPEIDSATLENILFSTAKDLGPPGRDSQFGFGLVDPYRALNVLAAKVAAKGASLPAFTPPPDPATVRSPQTPRN